ncbi:hypothetical protein BDM02DRAFT_3193998 [Thelephora ganbajun]|uniref:Uncharacterized protein n=1 Tax=Thelephora ganbajun TaxID=370292 RepID=A0ACB6YYW1_THEGA|nr:hypothetical protein BDM02DRAFT_3193998 [Thelephora ganbajun]
MSLQDNKVFVSHCNQKITCFVIRPCENQDDPNLETNNPAKLVDEVLAQEGWEMPCHVFDSFSSFNDQVWQQAISSLRNIDENHRKHLMYDDERILFQLIERGVVDLSLSDDIAIGSIVRYMAVVGEHLWSLLECQQAMVHCQDCRVFG